LVPIKLPTRRQRQQSTGGAETDAGVEGDEYGNDEQSDVSSITIDEHQKMLKYLYAHKLRQASICISTPTMWCCFPQQALAPHAGRSSSKTSKRDSASYKKKKKDRSNKKKITAYSTAPAMSVDKTEFSLFDELSDDDEGEDEDSMGPKQQRQQHEQEATEKPETAARVESLRQRHSSRKMAILQQRRRRMPWSKKS
jgi:hypothetical protein